jgi:lysophospholipase L1-like esterase
MALLFSALTVSLLASEGLLRYADIPKTRPAVFGDAATIAFDQELGWALNKNISQRRERNRCGEKFEIVRPPSKYLNKVPKKRNGPTILFLGDSFTHAHTVANGSAFYDRFERRLPYPAKVYAAGVGGYGTAQEYLLLRRLQRLRPDVVIWQLCDNDIINNVFELEKRSPGSNNSLPRPYYDIQTEKFTTRDPTITIRSWYLGRYLQDVKLAQLVLLSLIKVDTTLGLNMFKWMSLNVDFRSRENAKYYRQGLDVMRKLISRAQVELGNTHFIGLNACGGSKPFSNFFPEKNFVHSIASKVLSNPKTRCPGDGHWNHFGHELVGDLLVEHFVAIFPPQTWSSAASHGSAIAGHSANVKQAMD